MVKLITRSNLVGCSMGMSPGFAPRRILSTHACGCVRASRVKAFAVTTKDRIAIAPEIPSAEEAGFPWLQFSLWAGLFAPKGTPRDVIDKLNAAAIGTTHDPAMRQKLVDQGFVIPPREQQTPEALGAYQKAEIAKWWPIIKAANVKVD